MAEPTIVPRSAHAFRGDRSIPTLSKSSTGCTSTTTSRIWSAAACATCCSIAGRRTSTSGPRRIRTRSRSCFATAGSSAGGSASRTSSSAPRPSRSPRSAGRSTPSTHAGGGDRRGRAGRAERGRPGQRPRSTTRRSATPRRQQRSPDPARQHLRHAGGGRVPPRLHRQRAVLRHRHVLDHRLRRRARRISTRG